jgi:hypothetical protein
MIEEPMVAAFLVDELCALGAVVDGLAVVSVFSVSGSWF